MARNIDTRSRDILNFRPNITFIEPEQEEVAPDAEPIPPQIQEVDARLDKIIATADAVNALAAAIQDKINNKAKGLVIKLDPLHDNAIIQAMRRHFPDDDPEQITMEQYAHCRDEIRKHADEKALQMNPTTAEVAKAKEDLLAGTNKIAGLNTPEAKNGGLRPELEEKNRIIDPLDMEKFQLSLLKILMASLWKLFIVVPFKKLPVVGSAVPDELPKLNKDEHSVLKKLETLLIPVPIT